MKYSLTLADVTQWYQGIFDPVDFLIVDPLGRKLGYSAESGEINEIPGAFYSGNGVMEQFLIPNPVAGTYKVNFVGIGEQVYGAMASSENSVGINMALAPTETTTVTFPVAVQSGSPGDLDRDGCVDENDRVELEALLNTFSNDPNHPGDIDGDGLFSEVDLELLDRLIANDICGAQTSSVFLSLIQNPVVLLNNGGFEQGANVGWSEHSAQGWRIVMNSFPAGLTPHGGSWAAWLGGDDNEVSTIVQRVTVPTNASILSYFAWIASAESSCNYDFAGVAVNGDLVQQYGLCQNTNTSGWVKKTVDLGAYAGLTVSLEIRSETDSSNISSLFVDDIVFTNVTSYLSPSQHQSDIDQMNLANSKIGTAMRHETQSQTYPVRLWIPQQR
ncbi:MAG: immune inhibitor A [Anaerolineae bacterium]|nr:immune inhibitor A [Anaerolineae bacterium]